MLDWLFKLFKKEEPVSFKPRRHFAFFKEDV
jgi:hypothetical protein